MSASVCLACCVSVMIPWVKTPGLPDSIISSKSSSPTCLPAKQEVILKISAVLTDVKLSLNSALATLSVVGLSFVVRSHYLMARDINFRSLKLTSTNFRESVECWVFRIRRSAPDVPPLSSCSMLFSITRKFVLSYCMCWTYASASLSLCWQSFLYLPLVRPKSVFCINIKKFILTSSSLVFGSLTGLERIAECFFITSSTLDEIISILPRISSTCSKN